jgi:hypothetical protein
MNAFDPWKARYRMRNTPNRSMQEAMWLQLRELADEKARRRHAPVVFQSGRVVPLRPVRPADFGAHRHDYRLLYLGTHERCAGCGVVREARAVA